MHILAFWPGAYCGCCVVDSVLNGATFGITGRSLSKSAVGTDLNPFG